MKRLTLIFMIVLGLNVPSVAQDLLEVNRVSSDSLVSYIRHNIDPNVYFVKDSGDEALYSVSGERTRFLDAALGELKDKGYTVSFYSGRYYVLSGKGLAVGLPAGYFDNGDGSSLVSESLLEYVNAQEQVASFQNKVYEIGERKEGRAGMAYLNGYVRDVSTGEPLVGVSVYDEQTRNYALTDAFGFYRIHIPIGDNVLNFSGYSLDDLRLNLVVNDDGRLDAVMKEKVTSLKGAVVSAESMANHRTSSLGLEKVRVNVISKVPSAFGEADVLKVVLTLPGVKSTGEASSGFNVRGGSVDQNLILFNDGTIYNPSHMFGIFSAFNTDVINDIELYKSSIPANYGGRISSVLEVRGKEGNTNKVSGSLGLGILTSRFCLEGPLGSERTSFILGGRTTYSNWILNMIPENSGYSGGKAAFNDLNVGVTHKLNENNSIHAYGYYSRDRFSFSTDTTFHYSNLNLSLKWMNHISERHSMELTGGYDRYDNDIESIGSAYNSYSVNTTIEQFFAKLNFKYSASGGHSINYGLNSIFYQLNPGILSPLTDESKVVSRTLKMERGLEVALFADDNWTINDRLSVEGGLRISGFAATAPGKFYWAPEPRISAKYSLKDNLSLKAGFNRMSQYIHLISNSSSISPMDTWKLVSADLKPQSGWQAAAGLYWTVADSKVDLSVETYYKRMDNSIDYKSGAVLTMNEHLTDDLVYTKGKAYGVEFMARKDIGKLNGWISYTYSRSLLREKGDRGLYTINGGDWYCAPHDKPHDVKVVGNYKFTHRYSISFNLDYATGRPVTIPIGQYRYGGGYRLAYSDRNGYRIPDYFRLDLALNIDPGHYLRKLTHMSVNLGVYNVTGRKNAYSVYYSSDGGEQVNGYMLSVFAGQVPYINLNLKF